MKISKQWRGMTAAILTLVSTLALADDHYHDYGSKHSGFWQSKTIKVDVAESMPKFVFDEAPVLPNGMPAYGNPFITQGYIYPAGTLDGSSGVLADGSPEFPDIVIGEWTCRGYMIGEGADTKSGPWVVSTQLFDFYDEPGYARGKSSGRVNLVTEGYELADVGTEFSRAITGGTGRYKKASGQARQTLLGFNDSEGVNLRLKIRIR